MRPSISKEKLRREIEKELQPKEQGERERRGGGQQ